MADHARNTLHNIGNILNSVNTAAGLAESRLRDPLEGKLDRANGILAARAARREEDEELAALAAYYGELAGALREGRGEALAQLARLRRKTALIAEILQEQREEVPARAEKRPCSCQQLVREVLEMRRDALEREGVRVVQEMGGLGPVPLDQVKVIHILINLVDNAVQAMAGTPREERVLTISLHREEGAAVLRLADRGRGIPEGELEAVFRHGFTTRPEGQGFGLHSCANYMAEMGGSIAAESGGPGRGAAFTLRFPLA
jgi:signal transduction histidine kinase